MGRTLEQMLQLHANACLSSADLNVYLKAPQWQLPRYSIMVSDSDMVVQERVWSVCVTP
jgi:hypothetical protein